MAERRDAGSEIFGVFACGALSGAICALISAKSYISNFYHSEDAGMPYADVVVVVLTCVTVVITCAALVIGMLGIFGYRMIKDEALRISVKASVEKSVLISVDKSVAASIASLEKEMNEGGLIKKILEDRAKVIIAEYNLKSISLNEWGNENKENGE